MIPIRGARCLARSLRSASHGGAAITVASLLIGWCPTGSLRQEPDPSAASRVAAALDALEILRVATSSSEASSALFLEVLDLCAGAAHDGMAPAAPLTDTERRALFGALSGLPDAALTPTLREFAATEHDETLRSVAIEIAGELLTPAEIDVLLSLVEPADDGQLLARESMHALRRAAARIAERCPDQGTAGWAALAEAHPRPRTFLVRGLADAATSDAVSVLLELVRRATGDRPFVLSELRRALARDPAESRPELRAHLRDALTDDDPASVYEAVLVVTQVRDLALVPELIELLEHPQAGVKERAYRALLTLTGTYFARSPEAWRAWYEAELAWWEEEGATHVQHLFDEERATIAGALCAISAHRLFAGQLVEAIREAALVHDDPQVLVQVCAALRRLDSPLAMPILCELSEHLDPRVRRAADAAIHDSPFAPKPRPR